VRVLLVQGSARPRSNTGALLRFLQTRLEGANVSCHLYRVPLDGPSCEDLEGETGFAGVLLTADAVVLAAPVYFDGPPSCAMRLLEELHRRRAVYGGIGPGLYGIAHSGFVEPSQRRPLLHTMELFSRAMSWPWQGGVGFGGTSPIDGRPLEEAGGLAARAREGLALAAEDIAAGSPFSERTAAVCGRSPFPLPRRVVLWLVNRRTLAAGKSLDFYARPYQAKELETTGLRE